MSDKRSSPDSSKSVPLSLHAGSRRCGRQREEGGGELAILCARRCVGGVWHWGRGRKGWDWGEQLGEASREPLVSCFPNLSQPSHSPISSPHLPPSHSLPSICKLGTQGSTLPAPSAGHLTLSLHASQERRRASLSPPSLPALCPSSSPACPLTSAYKPGVQEGIPFLLLHCKMSFFLFFLLYLFQTHIICPASPCAHAGFL